MNWKDIKGYEGLYQVNELGQVKSLGRYRKTKNDYRKEIMLKAGLSARTGYLTVVLCKNGKCKSYHVHRLVAEAFLTKTDLKNVVNHKDGNKLNNALDNLEYTTARQNCRHAIITRLNPISKAILQYDKDGTFVKYWQSINMASKFLNVSTGTIRNILNNKNNRQNFIFKELRR